MPDIKLTIKSLKKLLVDDTAREENLHEWLRTSTGYAKSVFGINHPRVRLMDTLTKSVYGDRISRKNPNDIIEIEDKAVGYIKEFIEDMEELNIKIHKETEPAKVKYPLNLSQEVFWTIFITLIGGGFALGIYIGGAKFDKEKIDYYNQIHLLESDTVNLKRILNLQKDSIEILKKQQDTLQFLKDSIDIIKGTKHRVNGKVEKVIFTNGV